MSDLAPNSQGTVSAPRPRSEPRPRPTSAPASRRRNQSQAARTARRAATISARRLIASPSALVTVGAFYLMVSSVLAGLWSTAAEAQGGSIVGYSSAALVWYIVTSEGAINAVPLRLIETIGTDIGSGTIETEMLRPQSVVGLRIAGEIGSAVLRLGVCVVVGTGFALIVAGPPPVLGAALLALPALLLAVIANIVAHHAFAAGAFWLRDAKSAWFLYQKLVFVLGGMLLPLEVLPRPVELVAKALPFAAVSYAPARLASGHLEPEWLLVQIGWLAVLGVVATLLFRAGERRLIRGGS